MIMPPPLMAIRRIVRSLGDCDSSDSESEAADKLLSDDKADGHVLSDIEGDRRGICVFPLVSV